MSVQLKVIMVSQTAEVGGVPKVAFLLMQYLNPQFFDTAFCSLTDVPKDSDFIPKGLRLYGIDQNYDAFKDLLRKENIDIMHIHRAGWAEPLPIRAAHQAGVPVILETNTFGYVDHSPEYDFVDASIHISKMTYWRHGNAIQNNTNPKPWQAKNTVIYPLFDIEPAWSWNRWDASEEIKKLKQELNIDPDAFILGRIGRPSESKIDNIILEMVPYLVRKTKKFQFIFIGMPEQKKQLAGRLGVEPFLMVPPWPLSDTDLKKYYKILDVLVHGSRMGECCSGVIAEAMAWGVPVVTCSTPDRENGQIEQVDHGRTGFVANYPKAFAAAVDTLMSKSELLKNMSIQAKEKAFQWYRPAQLAQLHEKLYIELAEKKGISIDPALKEYASAISSYPDPSEVASFPKEYTERLKKSYDANMVFEKGYLLKKKFLEKFGFYP